MQTIRSNAAEKEWSSIRLQDLEEGYINPARAGLLGPMLSALEVRRQMGLPREYGVLNSDLSSGVRWLQSHGVLTSTYQVDEAALTQFLMSDKVIP